MRDNGSDSEPEFESDADGFSQCAFSQLQADLMLTECSRFISYHTIPLFKRSMDMMSHDHEHEHERGGSREEKQTG